MKAKLLSAFASLYVLAGIVTFGHAWNRDYEPDGYYITKGELRFWGSSISAVVWPLYWSTYAWKGRVHEG